MYNNIGKYKKSIKMWELIIEILRDDWNTVEGETVDWPLREIEGLKKKLE